MVRTDQERVDSAQG
jgi:hypothetical protein